MTATLEVAATGCERNASTSRLPSSTTPSGTTVPSRRPSVANVIWTDSLAGPDIFVPGSNPSEAVDVMPRYNDSTISDAPTTDSVLGRHPRADLFARGGLVSTATLAPQADGNFSGSCTAWPTAHVTTPAGPPPDWSVGFIAGHARALPMDSVVALSPQDSARRAAEIARVASALPNDTAQAFRGLLFSVHDAHQFVLPSGDTVIAANVVRRLNQEANPQEEHLFVILERDPAHGPGGAPPSYVAAYSERASGPEDDVETDEVLGGVLLGHGARAIPSIVLGRDYGDGNSYTLVQRVAPRQWRARWSSAYVGC